MESIKSIPDVCYNFSEGPSDIRNNYRYVFLILKGGVEYRKPIPQVSDSILFYFLLFNQISPKYIWIEVIFLKNDGRIGGSIRVCTNQTYTNSSPHKQSI